MSTLRFGFSAKKIENKVSANVSMKGDDEAVKMVIAEYEKKIKEIDEQRNEERKKNAALQEQIDELEKEK